MGREGLFLEESESGLFLREFFDLTIRTNTYTGPNQQVFALRLKETRWMVRIAAGGPGAINPQGCADGLSRHTRGKHPASEPTGRKSVLDKSRTELGGGKGCPQTVGCTITACPHRDMQVVLRR